MAVFQVREVRAKIPAFRIPYPCEDHLFFHKRAKNLKCRNMLY